MEDTFTIIGLIILMTWMIIRLRSRGKFVHVLGIFSGIWFIWIFSILDIVAYLDGENINFVIVLGAFLIGISIILLSVKYSVTEITLTIVYFENN